MTTIGQQAELAVKVLSASAILTTIMGWPAVGHHYSAYGIPAEFVSTEAAIRAGILPALAFMVVFGYLWYVRSECNRSLESKHDSSLFVTPFFLFQVFPLGLTAMLIKYIGVFAGAFALVWTISSAIGLDNSLWGAAFWGVAVLSLILSIGLIAAYFALLSRLKQNLYRESDESGLHWMIQLYFRLLEYIELLKNFTALYLIYLAVQLASPNLFDWVSILALLVMAAFLSLAGSLIGVGMAVLKKAADIGLGNLKGSTGFSLVAVLLTVLLYSVEIYPSLSKNLGGGAPTKIDVWLKQDKHPGINNWPRSKSEGGQLHLSDAYLMRLDDKVVILVDKPDPPAHWIVVSRDSIELLTLQ